MSSLHHTAAITIALLGATALTASAQTEPGTQPQPLPQPLPQPRIDQPPPIESAGEEAATTGWFRVDTDGLATQFWFGATHKVGKLAIASDIYVVDSFAEFDLGLVLSLGKLTLTPMVGVAFEFATKDLASLVAPQLFTTYDHDRIYVESWLQWFVNSVFTEGAEDLLYTRNFVLYKLSEQFQLGPAMELSFRTNKDALTMTERAVVSLPVGGTVSMGYGEKNRLLLFLGYETKDQPGSDNISGRFSFVRSW